MSVLSPYCTICEVSKDFRQFSAASARHDVCTDCYLEHKESFDAFTRREHRAGRTRQARPGRRPVERKPKEPVHSSCKACGTTADVRLTGNRNVCGQCRRACHPQGTRTRTVAHAELVAKHRRKPCFMCKRHYAPVIMEFHHRDPEKKLFNISSPTKGSSQADLEVEIAKCDVLCANCHNLVTANVAHLGDSLTEGFQTSTL